MSLETGKHFWQRLFNSYYSLCWCWHFFYKVLTDKWSEKSFEICFMIEFTQKISLWLYKFEIEMSPNWLDNYIGLFEDDLCTLTDTSNTWWSFNYSWSLCASNTKYIISYVHDIHIWTTVFRNLDHEISL